MAANPTRFGVSLLLAATVVGGGWWLASRFSAEPETKTVSSLSQAEKVTRRINQPGPPRSPITAVEQFSEWTSRYQAATPAQKFDMETEGVRLAAARRPVFKELIRTNPRQALAQAVPMVVRQQLPPAIIRQLEERVNRRADLVVYQGIPPPGEPPPAQTLTHRIATFDDDTSYEAHVFGERALDIRGTRNDALNGVAVDNQFAVNDEPVRLMEAGEKPDPSKTVLTACPVSGKQVISGDEAAAPVPVDTTVVETPEQVVYLCGGYHKGAFTSMLYGEGATGGPIPINGILPAAPTPALGMVKVIFIPMTFADQNATPTPEAKCYQIMRDVADYYAKSSYGKLTTITTVTPPVKLPHNEAWYVQKDTSNGGTVDGLSLERDHAREEAKRMGYDWQDYDCTVIRLNGGPRVVGGWGGTGNVWIYSDGVGVTAHEIGHSFALSHANFWDTAGTSAIGAGTNAEYGDIYDVMGGGSVPIDHYNAQAKNQVKWLPNDFISDITVSGTYRVHAFDQPILDPANRYAIRITKDAQRVYWGEVRQLYNGHTGRPWADKGLILGWRFPNGGAGNIQLIDTTPGSPFIKDDAAISIGQTFSDDENNIHITTTEVSATTPKYVDVVVNMGEFPGNQPPTLTLSASAQVVPTNATVTFTATASDPNGDTLAYAWQHFGDSGIKIVSPNSSVITRTFPTAGTYVVTCTASDMKGGTTTRNLLITVGNGNGRFTIAGRITSGGAGVGNVIVNANGANAVITDSDGYYTIPNLTANTYSMTPLLYGQTFTEIFNNSVAVGPNFTGADFVAEATPRVSIAAATATAQEPGTNTPVSTGVFTITRTGDISQPMAVSVNTLSGSATLTTDYTYSPTYVTGSQGFSTLTIPEDQASLDVIVTPVSDGGAEGPETVILQLGPANGYVVMNPSEAVITINDDPLDSTLPKVSVAVTVSKAVENPAVPAKVRFSRQGSTQGNLVVNYTASGTASALTDYSPLTGSVTIPDGAKSAELQVMPMNDSDMEALETVTLTIAANAATYHIDAGAGTGTISIADDDVPVVTVTAPDNAAAEVDLTALGAQADTGTFLISRTGDTGQPLTVYYALSGPTTGETALHGVDYEALAGVMIIPAGASNAVVSIIPRWDNLGEGTEWVTLNLGAGPTNYKLGNSNTASVTITDAPSNPATVEVLGFTTPAEPSTNGVFRFTVRSPSAAPLTVNFTLSGTASVTSDYTMAGLNTVTLEGSVVITPSVTAPVSQNVAITVVNDAVAEDLENLTLTITPNAAYQTFGPTGNATLWFKDEDQPTVFADPHVTTYPPSVAENGAAVAFYLSRTGSTANDLTVNYTLSGTAVNGTDYHNGSAVPLSGTATILAGSQGVDVTVRGTDDSEPEGVETVVLTLAPGSYGRGPPATLYLTDSDALTQTVAFETSGAAGVESASPVTIPVSLTEAASAPVSVEYVVESGTRTSATATAGATPLLPYWVRVVRNLSSFTYFHSNDGINWVQRGNPLTIPMSSANYLAGLAVTSGQSGTPNNSVIDNVTITDLSAGGTSGSQTSVTIGTVNPAASDSLNAGVYSISAGGGAITSGATSESGFRYVYFPISNSPTCTITARVVSETGSASLTRAGVMFRETTATNARFAGALAQLSGNYIQASRATAGSASVHTNFATQLRPWWVRLQRVGNAFTASQSSNGTTWNTIGATQTIALPSEVLAGLAVSSRTDGTLTTAVFDNVSLDGAPTLVGRTVGFVDTQGTDSLAGGVYTVTGSGTGIAGTQDECHFVAAPMTGDFTLVARVVSLTGGNTTAQAGVMIRESGAYRVRSLYAGAVANAGDEFVYRNGAVTNAFGLGIDFTLPSGILNFGIGEITQNISLNVLNDTLAEPDETLAITLRNASGAAVGTRSQFTYTIQDDDTAPILPSVGFTLAGSSAAENSGTANLTVTLSTASEQSVSVDCAVTGGTALAGTDFTLATTTVTFAPGETVKNIVVTLLDDAAVENAETAVISLSNPINATQGSQSQHTLTLSDDEFPVVTIAATDPNAAEAGLDEGTFTFSRTGPTTNSLTVNYAVTGSSVSGSDRQDVGTSVTFTAGSATTTRQVIPLGDTANEGAETVILTISASGAYTVGSPNSATVTIADDDRSTVEIVANDPAASENPGNPGQFTLTRTAPTTGTLSVSMTISGTATNGTDYTSISAVSFTAGQSSRVINILPIDDGVTEGTEVVTLSLGTGSYQIGTSNFANVTIADNDSPPTLFIASPGSQGPLIASGNGLMVSCTVSDDGAPQPVTLAWSQASGPGTATFAEPTQASTPVTFSSDGVYILRVTANDGQFTVSDQITVVVGAAIAPADWITMDVQPISARRGQTQSLGGVHTLTATGVGYAGTHDGAHVMMRQITGDGSVVARLDSLSGAAVSIAGVSIRDSLYRGARRAVLGYVAGTGLQFRTRTTVNLADTVVTEPGVTLPVWVKLERNSASGEITASYAADFDGFPAVWAPVGTPTVVGMDNTAVFGLTATSSSTAALSTAVFGSLALTPAPSGPALITEDAGSGNPTPGTYSESSGTYTIGGSGGLDGGGFFAGRQYVGDLIVTAKLADATSGATSAKSGIMIRESLDSGGYVFLGRIPQGAFSGYTWRTIAAGSGGGVPSFTGKIRWMRLVRQGNRITAFHAADSGGNPGAWAQIGQPQTVIMSPAVSVGFGVDNAGGAGLNVATFNNLTIVPLNKAPIVNPGVTAATVIASTALDATVTDDGYPAPPNLAVQWSNMQSPGPVIFGNPALTDTTAQISADGLYQLRLSASDGSAETFADLTFNAYTRPFGAWQAGNFSGGSYNPAAAADADPDHDGLRNVMEYAMMTGPHTAGTTPVIKDVVVVGPDRFLRLTVPKNSSAPELIYVVEATSDLTSPTSWTSAGLVVELNDSTTLRVRDHVPITGSARRFMRVWVHLP